MKLLYYSLSFYLCLTSAASPKEVVAPKPCTVRSSRGYFDLNKLHIEDPAVSKAKDPRAYSWNTTGWDLGYNFTMNFCGPVVEELDGVVGLEKEAWGNVSAYYKQNGKVYSIGQQNSVPVSHGRVLVLNYTNGSPCDSDNGRRSLPATADLSTREIIDPDDGKKKPKGDDDDEPPKKKRPNSDSDDRKSPAHSSVRRKSTIISLLCAEDALSPLMNLRYVAASPDECTYFFEARTPAGCPVIETATQTLSPSGVFGVIVLIAVLVYMVGGCVYSRMVLQQRGWRQVPNYALWAGMFGFVKDIFIILTSSCARFLPSRRGYTRVNGAVGGSGGGGRGRGRGDSDAENRLIDELNEEWDD